MSGGSAYRNSSRRPNHRGKVRETASCAACHCTASRSRGRGRSCCSCRSEAQWPLPLAGCPRCRSASVAHGLLRSSGTFGMSHMTSPVLGPDPGSNAGPVPLVINPHAGSASSTSRQNQPPRNRRPLDLRTSRMGRLQGVHWAAPRLPPSTSTDERFACRSTGLHSTLKRIGEGGLSRGPDA